jgi:hypothetical protein
MTSEVLSLAKYLASSRAEFALSEMNQYLRRQYQEKELYQTSIFFRDLTQQNS